MKILTPNGDSNGGRTAEASQKREGEMKMEEQKTTRSRFSGIEMEAEKLAAMQRKTRSTIYKVLDIVVEVYADVEHTAELRGSCGHCTGCAASNSDFSEEGVKVSENLGIVYYNTCYITPIIMWHNGEFWSEIAQRQRDGWVLRRAIGKVASILLAELENAVKYQAEKTKKLEEQEAKLA